MRTKRVLKYVLLAVFGYMWLGLSPAAAQLLPTCTFSMSNMTFAGDTTLGAPLDTTGTLHMECEGLLSLGRPVLVCPDLGTGQGGATATSRQMTNGIYKLNYQLYQDAGRQIVWGSSTWPYAGRAQPVVIPLTPVIGLLIGRGSANVTVYGRVLPNQQTAAAGLFTSRFLAADAPFHFRFNDGNGCNTAVTPSVGSPNIFTVSVTVLKNCLVTAQNIDFGSHGVLNSNLDKTGQVSVNCSPTLPYNISLSNGGTGTGPTQRRMIKAPEFITYGLYRDSGFTQPWGAVRLVNTYDGTGAGTVQNIPVYARIPPQRTPSPGLYTDTIVVTVEY